MSVLVYAESWEGKYRKSTYEAISYAYKTAQILNDKVLAISVGDVSDDDLANLGKYGADRVLSYSSLNKSDNEVMSKIISDQSKDSSLIIFSNTYTAKMIAPRVSIRTGASLITNVISFSESNDINVKRQSFSSKAIETCHSMSDKTILSISVNAFDIIENPQEIVVDKIDFSDTGSLIIEDQETTTSKISLSEAEIVVSAGRGLKGPDNWGMIEDLASLLNAATACSKPVSDIGWRPHSEHVGQTGKAVAPNLYIAIGISGAIQHLAGVNSSKVMVVINTDAEAPFFKAADYGIVGDAFEVVPKMIEAIKDLKN